MILTCPTCQSGLEVPDGTTAHVRCPTCRTVFAPDEGPAAAPPPPRARPAARPRRVEDDEDDRPRRRPRRRDEDDRDRESDRTRRRREREEREAEAKALKEHERKMRQRRREEMDAKMSPEERRVMRGQFTRAMWGCKLVSISMALYGFSLMLILFFLALANFRIPIPELVMLAGVLGLLNWVLGAVGTGLCIAGRPYPGHWGYAIAAGTAVLAHAIVMLAMLAKAGQYNSLMGREVEILSFWWNLPTKLNALSLYISFVAYPEQLPWMQGLAALAIFSGALEVVRAMLVMVLVGGQARAAGDDEVGYKCNRAAGIATVGPLILASLMFGLIALLVETGGIDKGAGQIMLAVGVMGIHAVLAGLFVPASLAAREAADACELPFESKSAMDP